MGLIESMGALVRPSRPVVTHLSSIEPQAWDDPVRGLVRFQTIFSREFTHTRSVTMGVSELGPGGWLGRHRHDPDEVYHLLEGRGTAFLDGIEYTVEAGSSLFIPGTTEHGIRNGDSTVLRFLYVFALDSFEDVEYLFS